MRPPKPRNNSKSIPPISARYSCTTSAQFGRTATNDHFMASKSPFLEMAALNSHITLRLPTGQRACHAGPLGPRHSPADRVRRPADMTSFPANGNAMMIPSRTRRGSANHGTANPRSSKAPGWRIYSFLYLMNNSSYLQYVSE